MANRTIRPERLTATIEEELGLYHQDLSRRVSKLSKKAASDLAKKTKSTAPKRTGKYRKSIASKLLKASPNGDTYVWYVRAPHYRLTHLLVHGHVTPNGGRTKADPFLHNAVDEVLPAEEKAVEEAIKE